MAIEQMQNTEMPMPQTATLRPLDRAAHVPVCAICNCTAATSFVVHGYRLFACASCDFAFVDPATAAAFNSTSMFNDDYFCGGGAGYTNYIAEGDLLEAHGRRYGAILAKAGVSSVLDVGAAAGFVLRGMQQTGATGVGIEPNASMAAFAVEELGLDVQATTLERFSASRRFDAVAMLQVVDHLEDLRLSFSKVDALAKPDGWCLIEFGNRASVTARLLGPAWHEYAPPSVQRVFSMRALRRILGDYGFRLHSWGHPEKYVRADHALSLLRYKSGKWLGEQVIDRLAHVIPDNAKLRYPGDDITWALFSRTSLRALNTPV